MPVRRRVHGAGEAGARRGPRHNLEPDPNPNPNPEPNPDPDPDPNPNPNPNPDPHPFPNPDPNPHQVIANWHEAEARVRTAEVDTAYPDGLPHFEDSKPTPVLPTNAERSHLSSDPNTCRAIHIQATDKWCATQCATEECPLTLCKCDDLAAPEETEQEKSTDEWAGTPFAKNVNSKGEVIKEGTAALPIQSGRVKSLQPSTCRAVRDDATDEYCVILCATQDCPLDLCKCADTPTMEEVKAAATKEAAEAASRGEANIAPKIPEAESTVPG